MQSLLTTILEIVTIFWLSLTLLSCAFYVANRFNAPQIEAAQSFDAGIKEVMKVEPEVSSEPEPQIELTLVKTSKHKVVQSEPQPQFETFTVKALHEYIKADRDRREQVEKLLNSKYYKARKADLLVALSSLG